jgi:hypothetical protein
MWWCRGVVQGSTAISSVRTPTGQFINKVEIIVNFFQVYALMVILCFHITFPNVWDEIRRLYNWIPKLFSINLRGIFVALDFNIPEQYQEYIVFFSVMALPMIFFFFYLRADKMKAGRWYVCRGHS